LLSGLHALVFCQNESISNYTHRASPEVLVFDFKIVAAEHVLCMLEPIPSPSAIRNSAFVSHSLLAASFAEKLLRSTVVIPQAK